LILTVKISQEKIKRVKSNVIRIDLPFGCYTKSITCYCFPTFKDLLACIPGL